MSPLSARVFNAAIFSLNATLVSNNPFLNLTKSLAPANPLLPAELADDSNDCLRLSSAIIFLDIASASVKPPVR